MEVQRAGVEVGRARDSERRVQAVVDEEVKAVATVGHAEIALPGTGLAADARGPRPRVQRRVDLGQEAVGVQPQVHAVVLVGEPVEPRGVALAQRVAALGMELEGAVELVPGVEEGRADVGPCLADVHREARAGEAAPRELGVGVRGPGDAGEDVPAPRVGAVGAAAREQLARDVHEPAIAELPAGVRAELVLRTVVRPGDAGHRVQVDVSTFSLSTMLITPAIASEPYCDDGAVAQDLDPGDRADRDRVEIDAHRAAVVDVDQRSSGGAACR